MQLSTHTDFSLRVLIYLALQKECTPVTVQKIADDYGISANHVAKVAQTLTQLGYVKSLRGRSGGLVLAVLAQDINVGQVVRSVENLKLLECFGSGSNCPIEPVCLLKGILQKAQLAFLATLDEYSLADLLGQRVELEQLLFRSSVL
ncbi:MAG TPA: Rrf2 family transcriptional regulator [Thiopseudomonas sp.]|nr:Rrf2 family transcriptional regulator [Thiopseudomonas sp.]